VLYQSVIQSLGKGRFNQECFAPDGIVFEFIGRRPHFQRSLGEGNRGRKAPQPFVLDEIPELTRLFDTKGPGLIGEGKLRGLFDHFDRKSDSLKALFEVPGRLVSRRSSSHPRPDLHKFTDRREQSGLGNTRTQLLLHGVLSNTNVNEKGDEEERSGAESTHSDGRGKDHE
jgi:hypothetical protein